MQTCKYQLFPVKVKLHIFFSQKWERPRRTEKAKSAKRKRDMLLTENCYTVTTYEGLGIHPKELEVDYRLASEDVTKSHIEMKSLIKYPRVGTTTTMCVIATIT